MLTRRPFVFTFLAMPIKLAANFACFLVSRSKILNRLDSSHLLLLQNHLAKGNFNNSIMIN